MYEEKYVSENHLRFKPNFVRKI